MNERTNERTNERLERTNGQRKKERKVLDMSDFLLQNKPFVADNSYTLHICALEECFSSLHPRSGNGEGWGGEGPEVTH